MLSQNYATRRPTLGDALGSVVGGFVSTPEQQAEQARLEGIYGKGPMPSDAYGPGALAIHNAIGGIRQPDRAGGLQAPNTPKGLFGASSAAPSGAPLAALLSDDGQQPAAPTDSSRPNGWIAQQARERGGLFGAQAGAANVPAPTGPNAAPAMPAPQPLGGSMRQPFDYAAELQKLLPPEHKASTLQKIAMILGPALMGASGNQAGANAFFANMQARRQREDQRRYEVGKTLADWKHQDWARQNGADLDASAPFTIGRDRLAYNPATGATTSLYHGPADWESYASTLGLEPGTPAYVNAAKDYVLRSNGPTAYANDVGLDDHRTGNRLKLEGVRQGNRETLEGVRQGNRIATRQTPTYHDTHPTPRGGKAGGGRPRATNAAGQVMEFDGKAWVPVH